MHAVEKSRALQQPTCAHVANAKQCHMHSADDNNNDSISTRKCLAHCHGIAGGRHTCSGVLLKMEVGIRKGAWRRA